MNGYESEESTNSLQVRRHRPIFVIFDYDNTLVEAVELKPNDTDFKNTTRSYICDTQIEHHKLKVRLRKGARQFIDTLNADKRFKTILYTAAKDSTYIENSTKYFKLSFDFKKINAVQKDLNVLFAMYGKRYTSDINEFVENSIIFDDSLRVWCRNSIHNKRDHLGFSKPVNFPDQVKNLVLVRPFISFSEHSLCSRFLGLPVNSIPVLQSLPDPSSVEDDEEEDLLLKQEGVFLFSVYKKLLEEAYSSLVPVPKFLQDRRENLFKHVAWRSITGATRLFNSYVNMHVVLKEDDKDVPEIDIKAFLRAMFCYRPVKMLIQDFHQTAYHFPLKYLPIGGKEGEMDDIIEQNPLMS